MKTIALIATVALGACASGVIPHAANHPANPQAQAAAAADTTNMSDPSQHHGEHEMDMSDDSRHHGEHTMPQSQSPVVEHDHEATAKIYSCPMHPEITSHDPGTCSICHMHLTTESDE